MFLHDTSSFTLLVYLYCSSPSYLKNFRPPLASPAPFPSCASPVLHTYPPVKVACVLFPSMSTASATRLPSTSTLSEFQQDQQLHGSTSVFPLLTSSCLECPLVPVLVRYASQHHFSSGMPSVPIPSRYAHQNLPSMPPTPVLTQNTTPLRNQSWPDLLYVPQQQSPFHKTSPHLVCPQHQSSRHMPLPPAPVLSPSCPQHQSS